MTNLLGDFLRRRRNQTSAMGPTTSGPRRTPGLRREEVAVAAAVSVDYYTRLEQGRERNPSDAVLASIAKAMRLSRDDLVHAMTLRDAAHPRRVVAGEPVGLTRRMQAFVDAWSPRPAYALDALSDVVAANDAAYDLFVGLGEPNGARANTCRYLLIDPRARARFVDWEDVARASVAALRDHGTKHAEPVSLSRRVSELSAESEQFAAWWNDYAVAPRRSSRKTFRTVDGETFALDYEVLTVPETDVRVTMYLGPVPDARPRE